MLRILVAETSTQAVLVLKGRLVGAGVPGLMQICSTVMAQLIKRRLVIDLTDVVVISQEAENLLLELVSQGAKLRARGALARGVLQQLARRSHKQPDELIDTAPRLASPDCLHLTVADT